MNIRASIEKLINIQNPGILTRLLLLPLSLGAVLYRFAVSARSFLYKSNILPRLHIPCKVIAVGNITVGGTGKTPTVCCLAQRLKQENFRVAVLNRGYRGSKSDKPQVVSDGKEILATAESVGDEARMLAEKLPEIPILASKDRASAGHRAVELFNTQIVILDDGFQHLRLERDLDVVLINAHNPFGNGFLLPRGTLREPLSALRRARLIILTKTDISCCNIKELEDRIRSYNPDVQIFKSCFTPVRLVKVFPPQEVPFASVEGRTCVGLCSIADPESFFLMLKRLNVFLMEKLVFPDHHAYCQRDYKFIKQQSDESELIITTQKDIAKIDLNMIQKEKLLVMEIEQVIDQGDLFFRNLRNLAGLD
jgi:tetraacyldisaccharide 4'-kinase